MNNDMLKPASLSEFLPQDMVETAKPEVHTTVPTRKIEEEVVPTQIAQPENNVPLVTKQMEDLNKPESNSIIPVDEDPGFVSTALEEFVKGLQEENEILTNNDTSVQDMLKSIKVDLTSVEISNASAMNIERTENLFKNKKVTQVVACQSSYTAFMSALNNQELQNIMGSDEDFYSFRKRIFKLLFKHMEDTSIGKLDFKTWEKLTSFFDIETLLYGVYCQTFPYENTYNVTCTNRQCNHKYTAITNNNTLVEVRGESAETFAHLNDVLKNVHTPQQALDKSLVHTTKRMICEESKIIVDIRIPSVHDYLEGILSKVNPQFAEENSSSLGMALFVNKLLVPDLATLKDTGKLTFFEVTDPNKIVEYLSNLSFLDAETVTNEINAFTEKYRVGYSIKNVRCPECGEVIDEIPLDMESLLFHTIHTIRTRKAK